MSIFRKTNAEQVGELLGKEIFPKMCGSLSKQFANMISVSRKYIIGDIVFEMHVFVIAIFNSAFLIAPFDLKTKQEIQKGFQSSVEKPITKLRQIGLRIIDYENAIKMDKPFINIGKTFSKYVIGNSEDEIVVGWSSMIFQSSVKSVRDMLESSREHL